MNKVSFIKKHSVYIFFVMIILLLTSQVQLKAVGFTGNSFPDISEDLEECRNDLLKGENVNLLEIQDKLNRISEKLESSKMADYVKPLFSDTAEALAKLKFEVAQRNNSSIGKSFSDAIEKIKNIKKQCSWIIKPAQPMSEAENVCPAQPCKGEPGYGKDWLVFPPSQSAPGKSKLQPTGFIFYPGGLVDPRAYSVSARAIAAEGFLVVIPKMPSNLAVMGINKANQIMLEFPEIRRWVIGGHSLGGAMAAKYTGKNPGKIHGLALWAAYPSCSDDLSKLSIPALTIYGTNDLIAKQKKLNESMVLMPADSSRIVLIGANHGQFGFYGVHPGDGRALMSRHEQTEKTVFHTVKLLRKVALQPWP
ncbi:MAG: hypothetical protein HQM10_25410 [Candidatus Riflebacteria bacterium]|nr:hypothetical protein [Candidatus Riflebacteria bacterium]